MSSECLEERTAEARNGIMALSHFVASSEKARCRPKGGFAADREARGCRGSNSCVSERNPGRPMIQKNNPAIIGV